MRGLRRFSVIIPMVLQASAALAQTIHYQGRLLESGTLVNGSRNIEFRILSDESPYLILFAQTGRVDVVDGFYSFDIGPTGRNPGTFRPVNGYPQPLYSTLAKAFEPSSTWQGAIMDKKLEVYINGTKLAPSEPISFSPQALVARHVADGAIGPEQLQAGAVQAVHLSSGALSNAAETQHTDAFKNLAPIMQGPPLPYECLKKQPAGPGAITVAVNGSTYSDGLAFRVEEAISEPLRAEVLFSAPSGLNHAVWINTEAELRWTRNGTTRRFSGIITQAARLGHNGSDPLYALTIESHIAGLSYQQGYSIRQEVSADQIISEMLGNAGLAYSTPAFSSHARNMTIQYSETDLDYITRLMERDGGWYIFGDETPEPRIYFGGSNADFFTAPSLNYYGPGGAAPTTNEEYICTFSAGSSAFAGQYTVRAYADPSGTLISSADTITGGIGTITEFTGADSSGISISAMAGVEADYHARSSLGGFSTAADLKPGRKTPIQDQSPGGAATGTYLIDRVIHTGLCVPGATNEYYYANRFTAYTLDEEFAPQKTVPLPTPGILTGTVTGPGGETTHVDEYGRVKVQFHWDTAGTFDENSSGWVHVMRPLHGENQSRFFIPEIGDEVLINFIQNDPDRPVIVGAIPSDAQPVFHALPDEKNRMYIYNQSTSGSINEIRLDKTAGQEKILITSPTVEIAASDSLSLNAPGISTTGPFSAPSASLSGRLNADEVFLNDTLSSGAYKAGYLYKDNQIVAWARISSAGIDSPSFGIDSVTRTATGLYQITIDATITGVNIIPVAVAEIDTQPSSASALRIISVNQLTSNTFAVYINTGTGTPINNDFTFMVTGR